MDESARRRAEQPERRAGDRAGVDGHGYGDVDLDRAHARDGKPLQRRHARQIVADKRGYVADELLATVADKPVEGAEYTGEIELDIGKLTVSMKRI